jgi:stage IV sporulation protein B
LSYKKITKKISISLILTAFSLLISTGAFAAELPEELNPVGQLIGISLNSGGVVVSELSELETENGTVSPAKDAGILPGDVIVKINGNEINDSADLMSVLEEIDSDTLSVELMRNGNKMSVTLSPYLSSGTAYMGVWIRDCLAGIGTMTFYDPETGTFGALGHSISQSEDGTGEVFDDGNIYPATILGIIPGASGNPGQITGTFNKEQSIGTLFSNEEVGIFGHMNSENSITPYKSLPVAKKSEIKTGKATILSAVSGEVKEYDIEITRVYSDYNSGRSMMIKITDDELTNITGGIIQGMSGSPIIQNGKLIGAVTHVLINDPLKGYAVSIEDMLSAAYSGDSAVES